MLILYWITSTCVQQKKHDSKWNQKYMKQSSSTTKLHIKIKQNTHMHKPFHLKEYYTHKYFMCIWSKFSYDLYEKSLTCFFPVAWHCCLHQLTLGGGTKKCCVQRCQQWHGIVKAKINHGTNRNKTIKIPAHFSTQQLIIDGGMGKNTQEEKKKKSTYKTQKIKQKWNLLTTSWWSNIKDSSMVGELSSKALGCVSGMVSTKSHKNGYAYKMSFASWFTRSQRRHRF